MYLYNRKKTVSLFLLTISLFTFLFCSNPVTAYATLDELNAAAEERKLLPIQSDEIENWPAGPEIGAEAAILMEANTGVILYAKNIHEKLYPASTTKILTCLLAIEHGNLDDMVSFSHEAVFSVPRDGSNMGMDVGESITLEQCLYGIMVGSANEAANAAAEYVGGTIENFVAMMNERAVQLGCKDSHFVNANGLYDENHYTSAYDLALIASQFFQNEMLCKIADTTRYHFEPTATQPDDFYLNNKHQFITQEIAYEGVLGGKTGYTNEARQTLVTCVEQNGMKLVCVILKEESPAQFTDTAELFDYGFQNFQTLNISENEEKYNIDNANFFQADNDIFGNSKPILSIDTDSYVIVPNMADISNLDSVISYTASGENHVAQIDYTYNGAYVGCAYVNLAKENTSSYHFESGSAQETASDTETTLTDNIAANDTTKDSDKKDTIFINVKKVFLGILLLAALSILVFIFRALHINHDNARRRRNRVKRRNHRREQIRSNFDDFDF